MAKFYYYYDFDFVPISNDLGTKHTRTFKATTYENALKQARKEAGFTMNGKQVYRLDLTNAIQSRADLEKLEAGTLIIITNARTGEKHSDFFNAERLSHRGYMLGCCLYPFEWIKVADESDYIDRVNKLSNDFNRSLDALKNAYLKAKRHTKGQ